MYRQTPDIYEMLKTLTLDEKEELLKYLQKDITTAKNVSKKSYLEEQWAEIMRLIECLKHEPYIDDQIEIECIWNLCDEMIKSGRLPEAPWRIRRFVAMDIISNDYYDYYGVIDPMQDLYRALIISPKEKLEFADLIYCQGPEYMKYEGARLYKECGEEEKYYSYLEQNLKNNAAPYLELINYYRDRNIQKAVGIAELGMKKCKDNQTDLVIFLIQYAKKVGDFDMEKRLMASAKRRRTVSYQRVLDSLSNFSN